MNKKPNCYECKWQQELVGSAHINCVHPKIKYVADNPLGKMMGMLLGVRGMPFNMKYNPIGVVGDPYGINKGWFNFPYDFDPLWLIKCNGFDPKEKEEIE